MTGIGSLFKEICVFLINLAFGVNRPVSDKRFRMILIKYPFTEEDQDMIRDLLLTQKGTIVYPTETFYALGCAATEPVAVNEIYRLKSREKTQPLLVLVDSWEMLNRYTHKIYQSHLPLLKKHWPGALTAILNQNGRLAKELNYHGISLGFRMTSSPIAQALIQIIGVPLVGTSANRSSQKETSDCISAQTIFEESVEIYIDGGRTPGILPSTLIDMTTERYSVVRKGMISI